MAGHLCGDPAFHPQTPDTLDLTPRFLPTTLAAAAGPLLYPAPARGVTFFSAVIPDLSAPATDATR